MLRYFRDKTQSEVAEMLGISQVQVSRLENKILSKLKDNLNGDDNVKSSIDKWVLVYLSAYLTERLKLFVALAINNEITAKI